MREINFFKHTENWFKGESVEGGMLIVFGAMLVILALYFWKFGHTPTTRVLIVPFLVVGLLWSLAAGIGLYRNPHRVEAFRAEYEKAPIQFIKKEKERVEGFQKWYQPLLISWTILIIIALAMFHFWGGNTGRAVSLALILFGVAGLMVDHTSEQNARNYHAEIEKASN